MGMTGDCAETNAPYNAGELAPGSSRMGRLYSYQNPAHRKASVSLVNGLFRQAGTACQDRSAAACAPPLEQDGERGASRLQRLAQGVLRLRATRGLDVASELVDLFQ
jgi:hypothetical protein